MKNGLNEIIKIKRRLLPKNTFLYEISWHDLIGCVAGDAWVVFVE